MQLLNHLRTIVSTARTRAFKIIFVPHHRWQAGDIVALEHRGSSGFANTDLDLQLKQHGIRRIVLIGMIANTCIESTGRFGMELGYNVTLVKDALTCISLTLPVIVNSSLSPLSEALPNTSGWRQRRLSRRMHADRPDFERIARGKPFIVSGSASDGSAAGRTPRGVRAG